MADIACSSEPNRIVESLLESRGLSKYNDDKQLIKTLSNLDSKAFTKAEIVEDLDSLNLNILSWIPTAYSNPYGNSNGLHLLQILTILSV